MGNLGRVVVSPAAQESKRGLTDSATQAEHAWDLLGRIERKKIDTWTTESRTIHENATRMNERVGQCKQGGGGEKGPRHSISFNGLGVMV